MFQLIFSKCLLFLLDGLEPLKTESMTCKKSVNWSCCYALNNHVCKKNIKKSADRFNWKE